MIAPAAKIIDEQNHRKATFQQVNTRRLNIHGPTDPNISQGKPSPNPHTQEMKELLHRGELAGVMLSDVLMTG